MTCGDVGAVVHCCCSSRDRESAEDTVTAAVLDKDSDAAGRSYQIHEKLGTVLCPYQSEPSGTAWHCCEKCVDEFPQNDY